MYWPQTFYPRTTIQNSVLSQTHICTLNWHRRTAKTPLREQRGGRLCPINNAVSNLHVQCLNQSELALGWCWEVWCDWQLCICLNRGRAVRQGGRVSLQQQAWADGSSPAIPGAAFTFACLINHPLPSSTLCTGISLLYKHSTACTANRASLRCSCW